MAQNILISAVSALMLSTLSGASPAPIPGKATHARAATSPTTTKTTTAVATHTPVVNTGKRGLCYTNDSYTLDFSLSGQNSLVSWGYDWGTTRYTNSDSTENTAIKFIPLLYNNDPSLTAIWPSRAQSAINAGADALLAFNEPDACYDGSACMSVSDSVTAYMDYMQPFANQTRLGAPAVTNGGAPSGFTWLDEFIGNCTECTIDFIPLHWYSSPWAFGYLQQYVEEAYARYGKPIWITEFGYDYNGATEAEAEMFLKEALPWLDAVPYVERYAYFMDTTGILITSDGTGLSTQGVLYNNYTASCPYWNNCNGTCTSATNDQDWPACGF